MSTKYHGTQRASPSSYAVSALLIEKEDIRFLNILNALRIHSVEKNVKRAKEMMAEWTYSYHTEEEDEKCLCNKAIKYCHYVKHYLTGVHVGPIGSTCIEKFDTKLGTEMGAKAKTVQKAYVEAKAHKVAAAQAAQWAVNIARVASAKAASDAEKRKTSEAKTSEATMSEAEWWETYDARDIRSFFTGPSKPVPVVEDIGQRLVPDNFNLHQGKTLAVLWQKHRSYCNFVMEKNRVYDPDVRQWFRAQGCSW